MLWLYSTSLSARPSTLQRFSLTPGIGDFGQRTGGAAGLVSSCPAIGFVIGPICAGGLYQIHSPLAPLFSAAVLFAVLLVLVFSDRQPVP